MPNSPEASENLDVRVIEAELLGLSGKSWYGFQVANSTVGTTERVVEIPWVLSRYVDERRVLDIGASFALPQYVRHLIGLQIPELYGVDLSRRAIPGITMTQADVRAMPYADSHFDLITCISTLEHIGRDNRIYGIRARPKQGGDLLALREMKRVLSERGRILITVPFGHREDYKWFMQYDLDAWNSLIRQTELEAIELAIYIYSRTGWESSKDLSAVPLRGYREMGAPGATAVLCASLVHLRPVDLSPS